MGKVNDQTKNKDEASTNAPKKRPAWALVLLLGSPILLFVALWAMISLPQMLANPKYNFVYSVCKSSYCEQYEVNGEGKIIENNPINIVVPDGQTVEIDDLLNSASSRNERPDLYLYDQANGTSKKLTVAEYNSHNVSTSNISPDGYKLVQASHRSGLFSSYGNDQWTLTKGMASKPVVLENDSANNYYPYIKFVGWVKNDR